MCDRLLVIDRGKRNCYGKNGWTFTFDFKQGSGETLQGHDRLQYLSINMGPYVQATHDGVREKVNKKHKLDFGITPESLQLFNSGASNYLYDVFEGGQVALKIERQCAHINTDSNSHLFLTCSYYSHISDSIIEYRSSWLSREFYKETKPQSF